MEDIPDFVRGDKVWHVGGFGPGVVIAIVDYGNRIEYKVSWGPDINDHDAIELADKDPYPLFMEVE